MQITNGLIITLFALGLSACASYYPVAVEVTPSVEAKAGVYRSLPISLSSQDARDNDSIIQVEQNNKKTVVIGAANNIKAQMQQALAEGLSTQGAVIEEDAPVQIELELQNVLARVIRGHISYDVVQQLRMQLTLQRDGRTITKQFRRSAQAEFPGRLHPELDKVTDALNQQLSLMVKDMLADSDVQAFVRGQ